MGGYALLYIKEKLSASKNIYSRAELIRSGCRLMIIWIAVYFLLNTINDNDAKGYMVGTGLGHHH